MFQYEELDKITLDFVTCKIMAWTALSVVCKEMDSFKRWTALDFVCKKMDSFKLCM